MTTLRQIERLVEPLLRRNDDLVLLGPWLMLRPSHHVIRGIVIDRTGDAKLFRPTWALADLCERREVMVLNWGRRFGPAGGGLWSWEDINVSEKLIEVVEREVLPLLRSIQTLDDFVAFADDGERFRNAPFGAFLLSSVVVETARGNLEVARSICAQLSTGKTRWSAEHFRDSFDPIMRRLYPLLLAEDRAGLAALLHEWEAYSVDKLGLRSIWEQSPFPLEAT